MPLLCSIKVVPSSGRNAWKLDKNGQLKCFLKNPPEKGRANRELIKLLAGALSLSQSEISIVSGLTSRTKRLRIQTDLSQEQLLAKLGIELQQELFKK